MNRPCQLLLALVLIAMTSGCGAKSFFEEFQFGSADIAGGVTPDDGNLTVGLDFAAYSFEGRLQIGIDSVLAEILLCFVAMPNDDDPQPICYPIPIAAWADATSDVDDDSVDTSMLMHQMLEGVTPLVGDEALLRMAEAEMPAHPG